VKPNARQIHPIQGQKDHQRPQTRRRMVLGQVLRTPPTLAANTDANAATGETKNTT
jgi:hypothetical protein